MDTNSKIENKVFIDDYFDKVIRDDRNVMHSLSKMNIQPGDLVELMSDIPARLHIDLIVSKVQCWKEIQKTFNCKLRIYAWVYRDDVEKYLLSLVQNIDSIYVTTIPYTLKELNKCTTYPVNS